MSEKQIREGSFSLAELGGLLGAEVKGDPELILSGIGPLDSATPGQLSFLTDSRYVHLLSECRASALIVSPKFREVDFDLLVVENPYLALAKAAQLFSPPPADVGVVHPAAFIGLRVSLGEGVSVGPLVHIGEDCAIGSGTTIGASAYVGCHVQIGEGCLIHPRAVILDGCILGNRVIVHAGAVIGGDGYGYALDQDGKHIKIPQIGIVQIDDDVEIGANTTIDRATFGKTWIKRGVKIDNLVMVAHNVVVGEDTLLVAQVGISGSTRIGNNVVLAGKAAVAGHIEIGDGAKVAAMAGVHSSVKANQVIVGSFPGIAYDEWFKMYGDIRRLPRLKETLKRLDEKVNRIEEVLKKG
ncbi:MAG: UDP-3-O-(3-hydroxymyristoyl)glucosamine N-acyltransferase [Syntrophobacteraceae bacterium]|nr:UDP-3-O-(3-hydroxymyristoyl)glucosamine N-acyltransferase [Syntrophobacteraceae bacterium]